MASNTLVSRVENERLFGKGVDIYRNYFIALGIRNILSSIGVRTSHDNDWFRTLAEYITSGELSELYDKIISPESRRNLASSRNHRTPPIVSEDDPDDILSYLSKNPVYRKKMWRGLTALYEKRLTDYKKLLDDPDRAKSAVELRFMEMKELFSLSDLELHLIMTVFLSQTHAADFGDFDIGRYNSSEKVSALARTLGILDIEAAELLNENRNVRKYGLVDNDLDLDRTFLSYLSGINSRPLSERFWTKYDGKDVLPWHFHGTLAEKHGEVLKKMIRSKKPDSGVAVLCYGIPGGGKTSFAKSLAVDLGKDLYFIAQNDEDTRRTNYSAAFRYSALAVAQKQLDPEKSILVIDEADRLLENSSLGGNFLSMFFGGDIAGGRDGEAKGMLNCVLDRNCHTLLFLCNSRQGSIDPSSRRRFDYSIYFDDLSATARTYVWKNALSYYNCEDKLSEIFIEKVSARYPVNPGGISLAVKNASNVCAADPALDFEKEVMTFLKSHCALLRIQESPEELNEPARDYSLDGLNIKSGIKLPRLIDACKKFLDAAANLHGNRDQPRMAILLHGRSGAGKTEFAKYLSKQLGKKLCVKNASDLLSSFVGGTEQRIAATFAEAEANDEVLLLDEADSLLSSRDNAVRTYEVSQVNTLLSEMERTRAIVIVSTNFIQKLDPAALRRFSFRLHFDYLLNDGKETFFRTYFTVPMKLAELNEEEKQRLFAIDHMTPSDFANVRRQFFYLEDDNLTNMELIEALETEIISKTSGSNYKGLGAVIPKMGF